MFSSNKNIRTFEELITEIKRYFELQKRFVSLEFVSKLIILLAALILGVVLFLIGAVMVIMLALCAATFIGDQTGSLTVGFASVSLFFMLVAIIIYINRKRWITRPVTNFLCELFLKKE